MVVLFTPRPVRPDERRAPLTPATVEKLIKMGVSVGMDPGLGHGSGMEDEAYASVGAKVGGSVSEADLVLTLEPLEPAVIETLKPGAAVIGLLEPMTRAASMRAMRERGVSALSLEFLPRTSRAQSMDVLSSQASIAGYKAVILAAQHAVKMLPMMMTAAGTLAAAKVFIVGAGVAGLQAIATAKRLGAVVEAFDVRPETKEQVQSLGARFVELPVAAAQSTGGYAGDQSEEQRTKQAQLMAKHVTAADIVVTTAAVFGRPPPMLIPAEVVSRMARGSVLVDLGASAAYGKGNCERTRVGETYTTEQGVTVIGPVNLPSTVAAHATAALANNFASLLAILIKDGRLALDFGDDILAGVTILHAGEVRSDAVRKAHFSGG